MVAPKKRTAGLWDPQYISCNEHSFFLGATALKRSKRYLPVGIPRHPFPLIISINSPSGGEANGLPRRTSSPACFVTAGGGGGGGDYYREQLLCVLMSVSQMIGTQTGRRNRRGGPQAR